LPIAVYALLGLELVEVLQPATECRR